MNATRPYVDRPLADTDAAMVVAKRFARAHRLGEPEMTRVGMNAIFAAGDVVIRVGRATAPAASAHELARVVSAAGVPVALPVDGLAEDHDGFAVTAWERLRPTGEPIAWSIVGQAVARIHAIDAADVPADYPLPTPDHFPWWHFDALVDELSDTIDPPALAGLTNAIDEGRWWLDHIGDGAVVCHGDVHPGNVLMTADGPRLIDFDLLCSAAPAWDHAMLTTYADRWGGDLGVYDAFAEGYGRSLADDQLTTTLGVLRNVASTLMRVRAGLTDDAARFEAERRLRYWRGDPDAPMWRAQ